MRRSRLQDYIEESNLAQQLTLVRDKTYSRAFALCGGLETVEPSVNNSHAPGSPRAKREGWFESLSLRQRNSARVLFLHMQTVIMGSQGSPVFWETALKRREAVSRLSSRADGAPRRHPQGHPSQTAGAFMSIISKASAMF